MDVLLAQDPQVGLPPLALEERILVQTQPGGWALAANGLVEPATESRPIDGDRLHSKTDDPASKLIHDHENPV